jgi:2-dehydropantoate 2-reductase
MNIGIIGGGAIGLLLAVYFQKNDHDVLIYTRTKEQASLINNYGIKFQIEEEESSINCRAKEINKNIEKFDLLIVCVKQYSLGDIEQILLQYKGDDILFLQNGMSHIEFIQKLSIKNCYIGIVEHGVLKKSKNEIIHTGKGSIKFGKVKGDLSSINTLQAIHTKEFPFLYDENWLRILKQKCLINCTINPLTSIFQVQNGELLNNEYFKKVSRLLFVEVAHILDLDEKVEWEFFESICEKTANNFSSMNRDLFYGRHTEIESMLGYVKKVAIMKKINVPMSELVYNMIKGLEEKKG